MKMAIRTDSCDNAYEKMSVCLSNDIMGGNWMNLVCLSTKIISLK